ncbi:DUF1761 domain-containing protein [Thalassotalea sp. M1531]|uniref:DUF1761 domain-containing protein n=1 Tax=Thalassotalea algicola TaxID=2716224 RepID=A0A7Y0Q8F2_9GAMM|nr:DUF1761 domain-containing protein [Thalassotalea algicola]NMP33408.1 DUF1761 domain-containing protein [Thalassotalea algicola]
MLNEINVFAVIASAISSFLLGGLWYSPLLFGKVWIKESGYDEKQAGHPAQVFGLSFLFALVAAYGFSILLGPKPDILMAMHYALLVGFAFIGTSFAINYQFSNKSLKLLAIDGGYHISQFLIYGIILAYWH